MADRGGIQLLPETRKRIEITVPGEYRLIYAGIAALVVTIGLFVGLTMYARSLEQTLEDLDGQLASLNKERQKDEKSIGELVAFGKQAGLVSGFLTNHLFWTKALEKIQGVSQPQMQIISLNGTAAKKELTVSGATRSYTTIARQIAAFLSDDAIKDVDLGRAKISSTGELDFTLLLRFDEAKLLKQSQK